MSRMQPTFQILAIMALVINFMIQVTPLWMPDNAAQSFQICTTQGIETITLNENGDETPSPPTMRENCSVCLTASFQAINTPDQHSLDEAQFINNVVRYPSQRQRLLNEKQRYAVHLKRGPPTYS